MSAAPRRGAGFFGARAGCRGGGAVARANGGGVAPGGRAHVALRRLQGREQRTKYSSCRILKPRSPRRLARRRAGLFSSAHCTIGAGGRSLPAERQARQRERRRRRRRTHHTNRGGGGGGGGGEGGAVHARWLEIREQRIRLSSALRTASQPLPLSCQLPHRSHDPLILLVDDAAALPRILLGELLRFLSRRLPAEMRRQSMSAIRCGAAAAVDSCGDASACSVNGGEGGAAEAAAEAAVASRDVRARWARYARSSSAVFRSRLRSCACEGGGVGGVHLGSRGRARHLCLPGWWPPGRRSDRSRRSPVYRRRSPRPLEVAAAAAVQYSCPLGRSSHLARARDLKTQSRDPPQL